MMKFVFLFVFLSLALNVFSQCTFAPTCQPSPIAVKTNWLIVALIAVAIAFAAVGIVYMLSNAFGSPELRAWANNEFYQVVATAVIVLLVFVVGGLELEIMKGFGYAAGADVGTGGIKSPVIFEAKEFMGKVFCYGRDVTLSATVAYASIQAVFNKLERASPEAGTTIWIPPEKLFKGAGIIGIRTRIAIMDFTRTALLTLYGYVINPLAAVSGVTIAQIHLLCIIDSIAMTLLLPLGIVLRAVPFCRGIGTAFMAIAVGFYLVYPLALILNEKIVVKMMDGDENWWSKGIPTSVTVAGVATTVTSLGRLGEAIAGTLGAKLDLFRNALDLLDFGVFVSLIPMIYTLSKIMFERGMFSVVILGAFLPVLAIIITFGVTRELAKILGSDINLNSILKII